MHLDENKNAKTCQKKKQNIFIVMSLENSCVMDLSEYIGFRKNVFRRADSCMYTGLFLAQSFSYYCPRKWGINSAQRHQYISR